MKVSQLVNAQPALKVLVEAKLPIKASYRIAKSLKLIATELATYEEKRTALCQEYGTMSEDKTRFEFPDTEKQEAFGKSLDVLLREEATFQMELLDLDDLGACEIETSDLFPLLGIILKE